MLETAVVLSEISIIAGSKEILSVHHFAVLVILSMRYAPAISSFFSPMGSAPAFSAV